MLVPHGNMLAAKAKIRQTAQSFYMSQVRSSGFTDLQIQINPIALRMAKTLRSFGCS